MGKSSKLFKALMGGVKVLKPHNKSCTTVPSSPGEIVCAGLSGQEIDDEDQKGCKDRRKWGMVKSASHNDARRVDADSDAQQEHHHHEHMAATSPTHEDHHCATDTTVAFYEYAGAGADQAEGGGGQGFCIGGAQQLHVAEEIQYHRRPPLVKLIDEQDSCACEEAFTFFPMLSLRVRERDKGQLVGAEERRVRAATTIQTAFRGLVARRALRALKGVVRLQALARGRMVREQAAATLRCVHALVRVQARVRARRVRMSEEGQAVQRQLQQRRKQPETTPEEWDNSPATSKELQAKAEYRQVAAMRRKRALAYAFSEQLPRCATSSSSSKHRALVIDLRSGECKQEDDWGWKWLERWMAAKPWETSFPGLTREHVSAMNVNDIVNRTFMEQGGAASPTDLADHLINSPRQAAKKRSSLTYVLRRDNNTMMHHHTENSPTATKLPAVVTAAHKPSSSMINKLVSLDSDSDPSPLDSSSPGCTLKVPAITSTRSPTSTTPLRESVLQHDPSTSLNNGEAANAFMMNTNKQYWLEKEHAHDAPPPLVVVAGLQEEEAQGTKNIALDIEATACCSTPGYMQSTQSAKAKVRQYHLTNAISSTHGKQDVSSCHSQKRQHSSLPSSECDNAVSQRFHQTLLKKSFSNTRASNHRY